MNVKVKVNVTGGEPEEHEIEAYIERGREKYGDGLCGIDVKLDGEYVNLTYHTVPFDRIRRITGYLVGTLDSFNDAKRAEERDRVKHGT